jgi:hypothetical protein
LRLAFFERGCAFSGSVTYQGDRVVTERYNDHYRGSRGG